MAVVESAEFDGMPAADPAISYRATVREDGFGSIPALGDDYKIAATGRVARITQDAAGWTIVIDVHAATIEGIS